MIKKMNLLNGIINFLTFMNNNWTTIAAVITLSFTFYKKVRKYLSKSKEEKILIAKEQIHEMILKMISDAENDYAEMDKAGSIKRSQVISEIFTKYPILSKIVDQKEIIAWLDKEIDDALIELKKVIAAKVSKTEA